MRRSASFSEADGCKMRGKDLSAVKDETKSLTSKGRLQSRQRRRSSHRRRSMRSPGESSSRHSREERDDVGTTVERHHRSRQRRKDSSRSRRSSHSRDGESRSRRRHRRRSAERCSSGDFLKVDNANCTLPPTKQRVSWQRDMVVDHASPEAYQQGNWKQRVRCQLGSVDSGPGDSSATSVSSSEDEDEVDPDWAQWVSRAPSSPRPVPLGCGDLNGSQGTDSAGRRVVIRYSSGSAIWNHSTRSREVAAQAAEDDVNSTASGTAVPPRNQSAEEKTKKPKFLSSVARRLFGSAKKTRSVSEMDETEQLASADQRTSLPSRPQHIPSPPRRKAPQVDPQKARQRPVARKRSSGRQKESSELNSVSSSPTRQEMVAEGKLEDKVEEKAVPQESVQIKVDDEQEETRLDSTGLCSSNVTLLAEEEREEQAVCQNVVKTEVHPDLPSQLTLEQLKVHTLSPDPDLIAANTYSDKTLGGSRPTSSTHPMRNLAANSGRTLPFSIAAAARYAGISPALLRRLCADSKAMADGPPDCELEDRETPNKQGYKALIRDHDANRRSKSPSPGKVSNGSKQTPPACDEVSQANDDTIASDTSRNPGRVCSCAVKGGFLSGQDGTGQHGALADDTFSDIPIYDCRDFPELGVSDLLPGGPSRHGNDTGCQCQCVQKGCGWTGSEISNNMLDDRRRAVAIRQFSLQSLMFGRPQEGTKSRIVIEDLDNAEGKAVQTISWLQSQMPYSRRRHRRKSGSPNGCDDEKTSADSGYTSGGGTGRLVQKIPQGSNGTPIIQATQNIARSILI